MDKVKLALVGAGRWGMNYVQAAADAENATVTQIVRRGDNLRARIALADAVVVAVHPRDAVQIAMEARAMGKPVLVEKPAGLSTASAEQLLAGSANAPIVLVGHQHLFSEGVEKLRGAGSNSISGEAHFGGPGPARDYPPLWDYGPHAASVALALLGEYVSATRVNEHGEFIAVGERGWLRCRVGNDWREKRARVVCHGLGVYDGYAPAERPLTRMVRAFASAVRDRSLCDWRFGASWAVWVAKLLESAGGPDYSRG